MQSNKAESLNYKTQRDADSKHIQQDFPFILLSGSAILIWIFFLNATNVERVSMFDMSLTCVISCQLFTGHFFHCTKVLKGFLNRVYQLGLFLATND